MARIAWVNLPNGKHVEIALTYIYGIGRTTGQKMLDKVWIARNLKIETLTEEQLDVIRDLIKAESTVEWDLRRLVTSNIKRLREIRCYRGMRHKVGLPVRGQRTRRNARTRKGPKPRVGGIKKR